MLKRRLIGLFMASLIALLSIGLLPAAAHPGTQAAVTPVPSVSYNAGTLLRIKLTIPYSWLRSTPSSNGDVIDTARGGEFVFIISPVAQWDGVQWWWAVRRGSGSVTGYVEQTALESAIAPPVASATLTLTAQATSIAGTPTAATNWTAGTTLVLAPGVPFAWVRASATPGGAVRTTLYPGIFANVRDSAPVWDGVQWWWLINVPALNVFGYVEQKSLQAVTLTSTPTASAPLPTATIIPGTPQTAAANWAAGTLLSVKPTVRFVWLRSAPTSYSDVRGTIYAGTLVNVRESTPTWDGAQWWWSLNVPSLNIYGVWVEQNSLQFAGPSATTAPNITPAPWTTSSAVVVGGAVPYVWLRTSPSSNGNVVATAHSTNWLAVANSAPHWDSVQWWWLVQQLPNGSAGWVEQNSLVLLPNGSGPINATNALSGTMQATLAATAAAPTVMAATAAS